MKKQNYDLSDFLTLEEGETVLWRGKPDGKVFFKEEKKYLLGIFITMIYQPFFVSILFFFKVIPNVGAYLFLFTFGFLFGLLSMHLYFDWIQRKKSTVYAITELELIHCCIFQNKKYVVRKRIDDVKYLKEVKSKHGGTFYYGRYRFNFATPFDFQKNAYISVEYGFRKEGSFNRFFTDEDYACFFDLNESDLETVQTLIGELRERIKNRSQTI